MLTLLAAAAPGLGCLEGTEGSQGMGVVSNNRHDRVLLPIRLYIQTLMLTDAPTPFLGTPLVPLRISIDKHVDV